VERRAKVSVKGQDPRCPERRNCTDEEYGKNFERIFGKWKRPVPEPDENGVTFIPDYLNHVFDAADRRWT
jgi:hypothetical protein